MEDLGGDKEEQDENRNRNNYIDRLMDVKPEVCPLAVHLWIPSPATELFWHNSCYINAQDCFIGRKKWKKLDNESKYIYVYPTFLKYFVYLEKENDNSGKPFSSSAD